MVLDKATYKQKWQDRFRTNDTFQIEEQDFAEFAEDTADSFGGSGAPQLNELKLPQAVVQGRWYLAPSGVWEARRSFSAVAAPAAGANWRSVVVFNGQAPGPAPTPDPTLDEFVTTFYSSQEWRVRLPDALPRTQDTIDNLLSFATTAKSSPPTSYAETLTASQPQVEGINVRFPGTQSLEVTPLAGVGGSIVTLQLVDSSDGNSTTTVDLLSGYAGYYYRFKKKDGTTRVLQFSDKDQSIAL